MADPCADETVRHQAPSDPFNLPPADWPDPVVEIYKKDVDRTLLRENLKLTVAERCHKFERNMAMIFELRRSGKDLAAKAKS